MEKIQARSAERLKLQNPIQIRRNYGRKQERAFLMNISLTGAYIQYPKHHFSINEKLHLDFMVKGRQRSVTASVVWVHPCGAGLKFLPLNGQDVQIIDDFIYFVSVQKEKNRSILEDIFLKI